jgi:adenylate cyclase
LKVRAILAVGDLRSVKRIDWTPSGGQCTAFGLRWRRSGKVSLLIFTESRPGIQAIRRLCVRETCSFVLVLLCVPASLREIIVFLCVRWLCVRHVLLPLPFPAPPRLCARYVFAFGRILNLLLSCQDPCFELCVNERVEIAVKPNKRFFLTGLYLRNLGANLLGSAIVAGLNMFTPLEAFRSQRLFIVSQGGWIRLALLEIMIVFVGGFTQYLIQTPLSTYLRSTQAKEEIERSLTEKAKRRLLNMPVLIGLADLGMWLVLPPLFFGSFHFFRIMVLNELLFVFFRAIMVGLIASAIAFFLIEEYSRKYLVPILFPHGRLAAVPGTLKLPILRRIRALYAAGTVIPMVILVGTLFFILRQMDETAMDARAFGQEFLIFSVFLCSIFVIMALRMNFLVGRSISDPLEKMLKVIGLVREGKFGERVPVLSNDEIGVLGDAGNDMIDGLVEREMIRETFGKYVTPEIRDEILSGRIPLDGERRTATVLFADLRDFSPYVEAHSPEDVVRSIRAYFTAMQKAISLHNGLVLQYVGDEIEAVFGVPLQDENHARMAVEAALEMRRNLEELNRERAREGLAPFRHGVGIHTGEVLAGNTGSEDRLSYGLIGNTVNLASRIQDLTKHFGCDILASEETVERLRDPFRLEKETPLKVKGLSQVITVYRVLG